MSGRRGESPRGDTVTMAVLSPLNSGEIRSVKSGLTIYLETCAGAQSNYPEYIHSFTVPTGPFTKKKCRIIVVTMDKKAVVTLSDCLPHRSLLGLKRYCPVIYWQQSSDSGNCLILSKAEITSIREDFCTWLTTQPAITLERVKVDVKEGKRAYKRLESSEQQLQNLPSKKNVVTWKANKIEELEGKREMLRREIEKDAGTLSTMYGGRINA